jgi:hypothetical protein
MFPLHHKASLNRRGVLRQSGGVDDLPEKVTNANRLGAYLDSTEVRNGLRTNEPQVRRGAPLNAHLAGDEMRVA